MHKPHRCNYKTKHFQHASLWITSISQSKNDLLRMCIQPMETKP
ncbi:hypothetical protein B1400_0328 [Bifidobacterium italicum]|uniref:Uncharacterized protein n=1 Tax=Bifidobacterium italicum TaxID=1960968 RepID=A0A2A2EL70_9BIFI|nr:hypothetical protein B1400_0328 [Bifidobacterium italicum]